MRRTFSIFVLFAISSLALATATQGGNITTANLPVDSAALWYGAYGNLSGSFAQTILLNATPASISYLALNTGFAYCPHGVNRLVLLFSNSSKNITSLSAGNITALDSFIRNSAQGATSTFAYSSSFATASFGNISNAPTAYTEPSSSHNFSVGYLQDQSGNFVFITLPAYNQTGFNGNLTDYQIMLPTNSSTIPYHATVDISCINATFQQPTGIATSNTTFNVTATSQLTLALQNQTGNQTTQAVLISVVLPNETTITIPNTSSSPGVIIISVASPQEILPDLKTSSTYGDVLELKPSGTAFSRQINVSFNLSVVSGESGISLATLQSKQAQGYLKIRKVNASGTYDLTTTINSEFLTSQADSFSQFGVYDGTPAPTPHPTPKPSGGSNGGMQVSVRGANVTVYEKPPQINLSEKAPFTLNIRVLRFSPYSEAVQGERILINPLIENPTNSPITIDVGLANTSKVFFSPLTNVVINPGEKRSVPFEFSVPSDMPAGFYSFAVQVSAQNSSVSYPVIMRVMPTYRIGQPTITRLLSLDYENMQTLVTLTATNNANESLAHLQFYENIPSYFAAEAGQGVSLSLDNASSSKGIVEGNTIKWDLQDMQPSESRAISYKVPMMITDMSDYSSWNVMQISSIASTSTNDIVLYDLQSPTLTPGNHGELSFGLFNAGPQAHGVTVQIFGPSQWNITPSSFSAEINSRDSSMHSTHFEVPASAESGMYGITLHIRYGNTSYDKQAFVQISTAAAPYAAPPITAQLTGWVGENFAPAILALATIMLLCAVAVGAYKKSRRPHYDESRLEYLRNIERMLQDKK